MCEKKPVLYPELEEKLIYPGYESQKEYKVTKTNEPITGSHQVNN